MQSNVYQQIIVKLALEGDLVPGAAFGDDLWRKWNRDCLPSFRDPGGNWKRLNPGHRDLHRDLGGRHFRLEAAAGGDCGNHRTYPCHSRLPWKFSIPTELYL